jgi:hypothetical protein
VKQPAIGLYLLGNHFMQPHFESGAWVSGRLASLGRYAWLAANAPAMVDTPHLATDLKGAMPSDGMLIGYCNPTVCVLTGHGTWAAEHYNLCNSGGWFFAGSGEPREVNLILADTDILADKILELALVTGVDGLFCDNVPITHSGVSGPAWDTAWHAFAAALYARLSFYGKEMWINSGGNFVESGRNYFQERIPDLASPGTYAGIITGSGDGLLAHTQRLPMLFSQSVSGENLSHVISHLSARMGLAIAALFDGIGVHEPSNADDSTSYWDWTWPDYYSVNGHTQWLGDGIESVQTEASGVYSRRFLHGKVIVNTTGSSFLSSSSGFRTLSGGSALALSIPAGDAVFLLKEEGSSAMSKAIQPGLHFLSRARVYFDEFDASGNSTGLEFKGNVDDFKAQITTEKASVQDFTTAGASTAVEAVTKTEGKFSMQCREGGRSNAAHFWLGTKTTVAAQTSGSFSSGTPDSITIPSTWSIDMDRHIFLTKKGVSALVVKNGLQTVTYTSGTDYELVDARRGLLYIPFNSAITPGSIIKCEYAYSAINAQDKVRIAQKSVIEGKLIVMGVAAKGPTKDYTFWRTRIGGSGDLSLIQSNEFGVIPLEGSILIDATKVGEEYGIEERVDQ